MTNETKPENNRNSNTLCFADVGAQREETPRAFSTCIILVGVFASLINSSSSQFLPPIFFIYLTVLECCTVESQLVCLFGIFRVSLANCLTGDHLSVWKCSLDLKISLFHHLPPLPITRVCVSFYLGDCHVQQSTIKRRDSDTLDTTILYILSE